MRLHSILNSFRRRWKMAAAVFLVVLAARVAFWRPVSMLHRSEMRFIVSTQPLDSTLVTEEEKYYLWIASEYVVASVSDYLNGSDFIADVSDLLIADGYADMDAVTTDEFVSTGFERSRLVVAVTHPEERMVSVIADATAHAILGMPSQQVTASGESAPINLPIPQFERSPAFLYPIDTDLIVDEIDLRAQVVRDGISRLLTAVLASLLTVLFLELRDPTIRGRNSAEKLTIPILGEIPDFEA